MGFRNESKLLDLILHTNATILIGSGGDIKTVSRRLGHSQTSTTLNIYVHQLDKTDNEASNKFDSLFTIKEASGTY